jgi:hypothetical protein
MRYGDAIVNKESKTPVPDVKNGRSDSGILGNAGPRDGPSSLFSIWLTKANQLFADAEETFPAGGAPKVLSIIDLAPNVGDPPASPPRGSSFPQPAGGLGSRFRRAENILPFVRTGGWITCQTYGTPFPANPGICRGSVGGNTPGDPSPIAEN